MKKISLVVLSFLVAFSCFIMFPTSSYASNTSEKMIVFTAPMAMEYAESFAVTAGGSSLTAADPIKLYGENGQAIGWMVNYYKGSLNHGYAIFDTTDQSLIAQWSFDEGSRNPIEAAVNSSSSTRSINSASTKVFKSGLLYTAIDQSTGNATDTAGNRYALNVNDSLYQACTMSLPVHWNDALIHPYWWNNYQYISGNVVPGGFNAYPQWWVEQVTGTFACTVSALMVASDYYCHNFPYVLPPRLAVAYPALWDATNTTVSQTVNGICYGTTNSSDIGIGFFEYAWSRGYYVTYSATSSPTFNNFAGAVNRGDISIFSSGVDTTSGRMGHSVPVQGYLFLSCNTNGGSHPILIVADGWNDGCAYVNFNYPFADTFGTFFFG